MRSCTYCESDIDAHDPVFLRDEDGQIGQFCNLACLSTYIDEEALVVGDACEWSPD